LKRKTGEHLHVSALSLAKTQTRPSGHSHRHLPCRTKDPPRHFHRPAKTVPALLHLLQLTTSSITDTNSPLLATPAKREREEKESKLNVISSPSLDLCLPHRRPKKKEGSTIYPAQRVFDRASCRGVTPHAIAYLHRKKKERITDGENRPENRS
jgi:hypothetical protein